MQAGASRPRLLRSPFLLVCLALLLALALGGIFASVLSPHDPARLDPGTRLQAPTAANWFGTDRFGRDVFSRVLHGVRLSLVVGAAACAASLLVGGSIGLLSGFYGRWVDQVLMRFMDLILSFPGILLALALVAIFGNGLLNILTALSIVYVPAVARVMRGMVLSIREREYVDAARALGGTAPWVMIRHVLPNTVGPVTVQVTLTFVYAIRTEATLSFLGVGVPPPLVSLGQLVESGLPFLRSAPWVTVLPGLVLGLTLFALKAVGDAFQDVLDPRAQRFV